MFHIFEIKRVFVHLKHPLRYEFAHGEGDDYFIADKRMILPLRSLLRHNDIRFCKNFGIGFYHTQESSCNSNGFICSCFPRFYSFD